MKMTKKQLQEKLRALNVDEETQKKVCCNLIGHSKIVSSCFGYVHCARCGDQIGDTLGGVFDLSDKVVVGHECDTCVGNYQKLTWRDKFMASNPFPSRE